MTAVSSLYGRKRTRTFLEKLVPLLALATAVWVALACDRGSPSRPRIDPVDLAESLETKDITFHFAKGDAVNAEWQQAFHEWATSLLGVSLPGKIQYFKYPTVAHLQQMTGARSRSWADPPTLAIHTPDPQHGHEAIHLYTFVIGEPTDYFIEGLAVGLNLDPFTGAGPFFPNIDGDNANDLSRSWLLSDDLYPIESIVERSSFRSASEMRVYPQAGSFVNFLYIEYGIDELISLTRTIRRRDSRQAVKSAFRTIYGFELSEAEKRWHTFLRTEVG